MKEKNVIQKTGNQPLTKDSILNDLHKLGVKKGSVLIVHSSLSSLGWVCGGAIAVIYALEDALGERGTIVMPSHSGDLSDPKDWVNPPVPESWWQTIRNTMPAYDPRLTTTRGMGRIAETFRTKEDVLRSNHPQVSFSAKGLYARDITANHSLINSLGENSPLAKIYDLDGWVLLLGVGHDSNTSIHLAEYRWNKPNKKKIQSGAPIIENNKRIWKTFEDIDFNDDDFIDIGVDFSKEEGNRIIKGKVGCADALLFSQRAIVDFATNWMNKNRK